MKKKTTTKTKIPTPKKICNNCQRELTITNFYQSSSPMFDGTSPLCKSCIKKLIDYKNMQSIYNVLQTLDMPFIQSEWDKMCERKRERMMKEKAYDVFGNYIRQINSLGQYSNMGWKDSVFENEEKKTNVIFSGDGTTNYNDFVITEEILDRWGEGLEKKDYAILEKELKNLLRSFECPDYSMEMIMKDICFLNLQIADARQKGNDTSKLLDTRSKLMNDGKMKPIQGNALDENDKATFGMFIKRCEDTDPIETPFENPMKKYIRIFMAGHLAKMQGLKNELVDEYEKEIMAEAIDFDEIKKVSDDEDDDNNE